MIPSHNEVPKVSLIFMYHDSSSFIILLTRKSKKNGVYDVITSKIVNFNLELNIILLLFFHIIYEVIFLGRHPNFYLQRCVHLVFLKNILKHLYI